MAFMRDINARVDQEPGTGPWFGLRHSQTMFGIFEAFPDAEARHAQDDGLGGSSWKNTELLHEMLAFPSQLYRLDVMHDKFGVMFGKPVKSG